MNIVVLDSDRLAGAPDFPPLEAAKYGWKQYPQTPAELLGERCWRSHVVVSLGTALPRAALDEMKNLALVIVVGATRAQLDEKALQGRPVSVLHIDDLNPAEPVQAEAICTQVCQAIDRFIDEAGQSA